MPGVSRQAYTRIVPVPGPYYLNEEETREALDLIAHDHFSRDEPGVFAPIRETLIEKGNAYEVDGTVYYDVTTFPGYGKLSGNTLDRLRAGHRQ